MSSGSRLEERLRAVTSRGRPALIPYLVAGYPEPRTFGRLLCDVAARADVIELGLPFSDPTADGPVIAAAARVALAQGVHLRWLCREVSALRPRLAAGLVLMSYLNPLLAPGLDAALDALASAGFEGLIVPDLPLEESDALRRSAEARDIALVQLVTPLTPLVRAGRIARASRGFLYAVTRTGTTGSRAEPSAIRDYLAGVRALSPLPVCAGFGLREPAQVRALADACDGLVVGTALIERLQRQEDPCALLDDLNQAARAAGVPA